MIREIGGTVVEQAVIKVGRTDYGVAEQVA